MLIQASGDMIPALTKIWAECFGDSEDYIDLFMKKRFVPKDTLVSVNGSGEITGCGYLLPCSFAEIKTEGLYLYAGGVFERFRGQGYYDEILAQITERCKTEQFSCVLNSHDDLKKMYFAHGFKETHHCKKIRTDISGTNAREHNQNIKLNISNANAAEYTALRNEYFTSPGTVIWDTAAVSYAIKENIYCGGVCDKLSLDGADYLIFAKKEPGSLYITETTLPGALLKTIAEPLCRYYKVNSITADLPLDDDCNGDIVNTAISFGEDNIPKNAWCGLMLI